MSQDLDYYELLQVSATAEPETIHRVYRLLAQRYHPDNQQSGSDDVARKEPRGLRQSRSRVSWLSSTAQQHKWTEPPEATCGST